MSVFAYVTNTFADNVSAIDTNANTVVDTITVGNNPRGIAVTPDGNFAYLANTASDNVSVIDTSTNTVVDTITVDNSPRGIAITPDGNFVYVINSQSNNVSVIDTSTNTVIDTITVGNSPNAIAITPDGNFVYVTNQGASNVSVIDTSTNTVGDTITVGAGPEGIAISNVGEMGVDAFVTEACPIQPITAQTPINSPNVLNLSFEVGNAGSASSSGAVLFKSVIIPAGISVTILDNGGATLGPENSSVIAGPNIISWGYTDLTLPAISDGGVITMLSFNVSLLINDPAAVPNTITDIAYISAPGDVNADNDSALCNITLR